MAGESTYFDESVLPTWWGESPLSSLSARTLAIEHIGMLSELALSVKPHLSMESRQAIETYLGERVLAAQQYDASQDVARLSPGIYVAL